MNNIYYVIGSYIHPIGSVDYINSFDSFIRNTSEKFKLVVSTKIIPNHINVFLESFDDKYVMKIININKSFPEPRIIIICTELF